MEKEHDKVLWMLKVEQAKNEANLERARTAEPSQEELPKIEFTGVYENSNIAAKIQHRLEKGQRPLALFSDIDNTFYRKDQVEAMQALDQVMEEEKMAKIYITGRDQPMVESQTDLPKADIVAGAVGTEIYVKQKDGGYKLDEEYRQILLNTWDREKIYQAAQRLVAENPGLMFQPRDVPGAFERGDTNQSPQEFKTSFHAFGEYTDMERMVELLEKELVGARAIGSTDIYNPKKFNIDLLPLHAGKELAIRYLAEKFGLKGFAAGDSGNDLAMLLEGGQPAILVGGARQEAKAIVLETGEPSPRSDVRELHQEGLIQKIYVGKDHYDDAAKGIVNALSRGDFNPENALQFVNSLYQLSKSKDQI